MHALAECTGCMQPAYIASYSYIQTLSRSKLHICQDEHCMWLHMNFMYGWRSTWSWSPLRAIYRQATWKTVHFVNFMERRKSKPSHTIWKMNQLGHQRSVQLLAIPCRMQATNVNYSHCMDFACNDVVTWRYIYIVVTILKQLSVNIEPAWMHVLLHCMMHVTSCTRM